MKYPLTFILATAAMQRGICALMQRSSLCAAPALQPRQRSVVVALNEDSWLQSTERQPLSGESIEVLFKYGPVVYNARCFDAEEYNASVRKLMSRYPRISRGLAEQEIHEFLTDANGYLAKTTSRAYKGPNEADLKPPVGLADKLLVIAWVLILVPAIGALVTLSVAAGEVTPANQLTM